MIFSFTQEVRDAIKVNWIVKNHKIWCEFYISKTTGKEEDTQAADSNARAFM